MTAWTVRRLAAIGAAVLAFGSAAVTLYWTLGGDALLSTVGGQFVELVERGGAGVVSLGLVVVALKVAGGLLALALIAPWGARLPQRPLHWVALGAGAFLALYGGALVVVGALVLDGVVEPAGDVDRTALRWHVWLWDAWFLVWGLLLATAAIAARRSR